MLERNHTHHRIPAFILGLLPPAEEQQVEEHIAACADCRSALQRQQQIGPLVKETLSAVTQPTPGRLSQLMPSVPERPASFSSLVWQKQLAAACLALILMVSSAGLFWLNQGQGLENPLPSLIAVTATMTSEPTATVAEGKTATASPAVVATPAPGATAAVPSPTVTFAKSPTPIAAILSLSH